MKLHRFCAEKRDTLKLSNLEIAERAEIPIGTVNKFFSSSSKSPSVYTVGPICRVLGVSLDRVFDIKECNKTTETEHDLYERLLASARRAVRVRNHLLAVLSVSLVLIILYLVQM